MATNRRAYDHRQFLHYPEKDPFSDTAQNRLNNLIQDFLHTGIAFANGASLQDVTMQREGDGKDLNHQGLNGIVDDEVSSEVSEAIGVEDEHEDYEDENEFFRVDKGKARDELEGPGLRGLWMQAGSLESTTPPRGVSVDDVISLSSGSDSGAVDLQEIEDDDAEGSYGNPYEDGEAVDQDVDEDEHDTDQEGTSDLEEMHSRAPSSEQEIIYIGDSDEEEPNPRDPLSNIDSDDDPDDQPEVMREGSQEDYGENSVDWAFEYDEEEEREGRGFLSHRNDEGHYVGDFGQDHDWQHAQGKESDEDESDLLEDGGAQSDNDNRAFLQMRQADATRRCHTSASLVDPWAHSASQATPTGSASLAPAAWGFQSHLSREREDELVIDGEDSDREQIMVPPSFEPSGPVLGNPVLGQDNDITNKLGLLPETDLMASSLLADADLPRMSDPSIPGSSELGLPLLSGHMDNIADDTPAHNWLHAGEVDTVGIPIVDGRSRAFTSPGISQEPPLGIGISTASAVDASSAADVGTFVSDDAFVPSDLKEHSFPHHSRPDPHTEREQNFEEAREEGTRGFAEVQESFSALPQVDEDVPSHESSIFHASTHPLIDSFAHGATSTLFLDDSRRYNEDHDDIRSHETIESAQSIPIPTTAGLGSAASVLGPVQQFLNNNPYTHHQPISSDEEDEEQDSEDYQFKSAVLQPAIFDEHEHVNFEPHTPSSAPIATADRTSPGLECHSVTSEDLNRNLGPTYQPIVTEVTSEHGEDVQGTTNDAEAEEILMRNPGRVLSEYVVDEVTSESGFRRSASYDLETRVLDEEPSTVSGQSMPSQKVLTTSVGSSTPPLSPTATITNSSSAPDPSIATSDLSTVNQAPVSIVASVSSPPPIHISRPSPTAADIRQPRAGLATDDGEENVLPDPRLPPEPTHLRMPLGIVVRSLAEDKEERAESMKVEPPTPHVRSESGDDSVVMDSIDKLSSVLETQELSQVDQEDSADNKIADPTKSAVPLLLEETLANPTDSGDAQNLQANAKREDERMDELVYPDSESEHSSEHDGTGRKADPSSKQYSNGTSGENNGSSQLLPISYVAPLDEEIPATGRIHQESPVDGKTAYDTGSGALDQMADTPTDSHSHTGSDQNSNEEGAQEVGRLSSNGSSKSLDTPGYEPVALPPTPSESGSSRKAERNLRSSTKGKGKAKAVTSLDSEDESPPPQSIIRVQSKRSLKRSRASDASSAPSKQPRLTRSSVAGAGSTLPAWEIASVSAVSDDRSDVSSVASSSSAVSRILRQGISRPSSLTSSFTSRSPSVASQPSPTAADRSIMPPPIRPYVPHNHSHHQAAPPLSQDADHQHTSSVSRHSPPVSSNAATPPPSTSTHLTRASCTDHKISLPGRRDLLYFLIPRCSLLDPEVEKDPSIVDCGVATMEEVKRAVGDLDAVGLDSDVLGVIRQLAGVQLMREGQVGYLPKPGERIRTRRRHRRSHGLPPTHTQGPAPQADPSGPSGAGSSHLSPLGLEISPSPTSYSGSSTSERSKAGVAAHGRKQSKTSNAEHDTDKLTSGGEDGSDQTEGAIVPLPSLSDSIQSPKSGLPRKRRLKAEDAAYKPENDATESSSDVEPATGKKSKRGLKRRRGHAVPQGENSTIETIEASQTPPKKRKRKDTDLSASRDSSLNGSPALRRKKPKRKSSI